METSIKRGIGWIDPEYVETTWENSSDTIDFEIVKAELYKRLLKAGLLWYGDEEKETQVKSLKELGIKESVEVNEAKLATAFQLADKVLKSLGFTGGYVNWIEGVVYEKEINGGVLQVTILQWGESLEQYEFDAIFFPEITKSILFGLIKKKKIDYTNGKWVSKDKESEIVDLGTGMFELSDGDVEKQIKKQVTDAIERISESKVNEAAKFKNTKNFEDFLEEIDGMGEAGIKKIMGKDYIDTPGNYNEESEDYDNDIVEYMISNMGKKEFERLQDWWEANVAESVVNEAEIKSDDEFKEYAMTVLKKAFGADFDEAKGKEVADGILKKCDGDYGAAVGMLTSSLGAN